MRLDLKFRLCSLESKGKISIMINIAGTGGMSCDPRPYRHCRYDVELNRARKPALKAVLQGDAAACRPMILCVSRVYRPEDLGTRRGTAAAVVEVCGCGGER